MDTNKKTEIRKLLEFKNPNSLQDIIIALSKDVEWLKLLYNDLKADMDKLSNRTWVIISGIILNRVVMIVIRMLGI